MDIAKLANSGDRIQNTELDLDTQRQLVAMHKRHIIRNLAKNKSIHPDVQAEVYEEADGEGRWALRHNPNLSAELQVTIWNTGPDHRQTLANRQNRSPEIVYLALKEDWGIRVHLAATGGLPADAIEALVNDPDDSVRLNVAKAQALTFEQFKRLAQDAPEIALMLTKRGNSLTQEQKFLLATHPNLEVQRSLAQHMSIRPQEDTWLPVPFILRFRSDQLRWMAWEHRDDFATIEAVAQRWEGTVQSLLNAYEHAKL